MYKLLLVSDKEEIRSLYRRYAEWNTLGFEQPDVAENAQQGIDLLSHRRYDAISSLLSVSEGKKFFAYLSRRPEMLGMETARDEEHLRREISTARRALSTRDASRQSKQVDDYTKVLQGEFFCDLLRGAAFDCTKIDERMQSLKLDALDAARPVVTSSFRLPQGDYFLSEVWRYGRDRLENALFLYRSRPAVHRAGPADRLHRAADYQPASHAPARRAARGDEQRGSIRQDDGASGELSGQSRTVFRADADHQARRAV
mgnify:CR=1 FL=1